MLAMQNIPKEIFSIENIAFYLVESKHKYPGFPDHIMAPYKSYKFPYYDLVMIGLKSCIVQSMVSLKP